MKNSIQTYRYLPFFFFFAVLSLPAQDLQVVPLTFNPVTAQKWIELKNNPRFRLLSTADTINLPFFDDFSKESVFPDTSRWMDKCVFINRDFPIAPINLGVATFEGLNREGYPYNFSASPSASEPADTLTSKPLNLGFPLSPADSVYFSFYYQAKGRGDAPDNSVSGNDSLILQFKKVSTGKWVTVWKKTAYTIPFSDTNFHRVMVPLLDTAWFKKGFQFRFRNHASPTGNLDHWHIDYVKLNKTRTFSDTVVQSVNLVYNAQSFLNTHTSMPWRQYNGAASMTDNVRNFIRNNKSSLVQITYEYNVLQGSNNLYFYSGGAENLNPYYSFGYDTTKSHALPKVKSNFVFPAGMSGNTDYRIKHLIYESLGGTRDSMYYNQHFYNYFSYDDGTAEASVFLSPQFSQLGYRYTLNTADTLRAVRIFFNPLNKSAVTLAFRLMIWNDNGNGRPGSVFYSDTVLYPSYEKGHNNFISFPIDHPALVMPAGTYYFGYIQYQAQDYVNSMKIGLDLNTNTGDKIFYNVDGTSWLQATNIKGSLMLRPVFGDTVEVTGIRKIVQNDESIFVFPVPAEDYIVVDAGNRGENTRIEMLDMTGRIVQSFLYERGSPVSVRQFQNGLYILQLRDHSGKIVSRKKIILSR